MENQQEITGIPFENFTWKIENFSKQIIKKLRSDAFKGGDCKWRILVGKELDQLSLSLKVSGSIPDYCWTRFAYFRLALINQLDANKSIVKETQQKFNSGYRIWVAFDNFQPSHSRSASISNMSSTHDSVSVQECDQTEMEIVLVEDQAIESSFERLSRTAHESSAAEVELIQQEHQQIAAPTAPILYPSISDEEIPFTPLSELIDLSAFGPEEAAFVPLLEEVCSRDPSLIESQRKRSPQFILWAFTALGQVLYFLKTTKLKDMTEDSCNQLQLLWEELGTFGFNLAWLEPRVQSALDSRTYFERVEQLKNLRHNVVAFENEATKLKAKLAIAEIDIELASRELAKVEEGFEEKDIEAELGYGI
ncbi:hypothetical protein L6164_033984 [Bauhinia variegata]|uniref:Uncharacterized protein n=1 Tax=Bauhinia variegata TaxID=167791 RepID=A0ACB9KTU1_BAUVA|nr:hypothetical protein L6164_033984 [Bauhinia variegata]